MGFHEFATYPEKLNYGSRGGPGFSTSIIEVDSGREERTAHWSRAKHRYNVAYGIKSLDDLSELITFYHARLGPAYGFRFKDWLDFSSAPNHRDTPTMTDQEIGVGDNSETQFQLLKKYTSGAVTRTRMITKITGSVLIALDGITSGIAYTVDNATGLVTFASPPGSGVVITAGFTFDVPVRFGKELDQVLSLAYSTFSTGGIEDVPLVEIVDDNLTDEFYFGGSDIQTDTVELPVAWPTFSARAWIYILPYGARTIRLPNPTSPEVLPGGGPYFYIMNDSTSLYNLTVADHNGVTLKTLTPGTGTVIVLDSDTPKWYAL